MASGNNGLKMCQSCRALIPADATQCEMCGAAGHYASSAGSLNDPLTVLGGWPVTLILITANLAVYAFVLYYQSLFPASNPNASSFTFEPRGDIDILGAFGSVSAAVKYTGEWWRLIAYGFLHGGILHIVMNVYGLLQVGRIVEEIWGRAQYILIYMASCIGGGVLVALGKTSAVGASGAIFGLIAAVAVYGYRHNAALQQYALTWLLYGLAMSFSPRVSMAGHVGGAIAGAVLAWFLPDEAKLRQSIGRVRVMQILAALMILAVVGTGITVARNLKVQSEVFSVEQVSRVVLNVTDNMVERDRAQALSILKTNPKFFDDDKRDSVVRNFVGMFGAQPETISNEQINQGLVTKHQAVCSDIGTIERMAVLDAEIGDIQTRLTKALHEQCAKAAPKVEELTPEIVTQTTPAETAYNEAFIAYWNWVEKRAARVNMRTDEMLPAAWDAFARGRIERITRKPEALPTATPTP
jgi:membrane associated rhomboid family serine protease